MNGQYTLDHSGALAGPHPYDQGTWPEASDQGESGQRVLTACIWVPTMLIAVVLIACGQAVMAMGFLGVILVLHSLVQPRIAIYALILIVPVEWAVYFLPEVSTLSKLVGILALLVSLPRLVPTVTSLRWDRCAKWMVFFLSWVGVGILWTIAPMYGLIRWQSMVLMWGLPLLVCLHIRRRDTLRVALLVFVLSNLLASAIILNISNPRAVAASRYTRGGGQALIGGSEDSDTTSGIPARTAAVGVCACAFFVLTTRGNGKRLFFVAAVIVMVLAILIMKSRITYLALPAALVCGILMIGGAGLGRRLLLALVIGVLAAGAAYTALKLGLLGEGIQARFESIFEEGFEAGNRGQIWLAHINAFIRTGFRGTGVGTMFWSPESNYFVAHNDYLFILAEFGVIGMIAFAGFHIALYRRIRALQKPWDKMFCVMAWSFLLMSAMTVNSLDQKYYPLIIGLVLAVIRVGEAEALSSPHRADNTLTY